MRTHHRHHTAVAVAGLAADAAIAITLIPPAGAQPDNGSISGMPPLPPITYYGAIAYAPNGAMGKAWRHRNPAYAESAALNRCGVSSCKVLSSFTRCGAVAHDGSTYYGGVGSTRRMAENDAMTRLGGGWIVTWACN
ncbi:MULTISPECIES: DUF4189 domain-containing protein [Mycobacterium]|uniref:DUF4189 domain-containing protein n=2 Tax=Mycobacterium TaxID=1763 RepID=A0A7Z7IJE4_9MYCO|nr:MULTISPECIES: DUF4189 domain-containing protein [Mycobacterium]MCV7146322.1 DUF4189 domain-containing protein [Mycobacterium riyadhense]ORW87214.1 hypothetical protein AWC22_09655 [Mycobacterium riyadhense]SOJ54623.1 hypothetical protein MSIMFB_02116 [Mycobacterium simulans]SON62235.1 hypothetical protein MSIMFI_03756 [Mycobacterium simulans]VTO96702.1 hypothetical protein BIN_B_01678 [Mycobacterium riyadhense]